MNLLNGNKIIFLIFFLYKKISLKKFLKPILISLLPLPIVIIMKIKTTKKIKKTKIVRIIKRVMLKMIIKLNYSLGNENISDEY